MIWKELGQHARAWLGEYSWRFVAALLILVLGLLLASAIGRLLEIALPDRFSRSRKRFAITAIVSLTVVLLAGTLALVALGVAGPVIGFIVTVGLGLGLVADSFSGLRIFITQPFRVGDLIEIKGEDVIGDVTDIGMSDIILETADSTRVIVPNRKLLDSLVVNHSQSRGAGKLLHFQFVLDRGSGVDALEEHIGAIMKALPGMDIGRDRQVLVAAIESNSVTFHIHFRAPQFQAELTASEFLKAAKARFDHADIAIRSLTALAKK